MTQNIYDRADFFAAYAQLERSRDGLAGAPEWPALRAMLPDLRGRTVVDLGCGFGWFCRWAREAGAVRVEGIDGSQNMLAKARALTADPAIVYRRADLETFTLPDVSVDLVYSSLALHYVENLARLMAAVHRALTPDGRFVFSTEHPLYMAPATPEWLTLPDGRVVWPVSDYLREGRRTTDWLARGVLKYHRTMGTLLNTLLDAGFSLTRVEEWGPTDAQIATRPEWSRERDRPMFLLVAARR